MAESDRYSGCAELPRHGEKHGPVLPEERAVYENFFPNGGPGVPEIYGFAESDGALYMLMEFFEGCRSCRKLILADALIETQNRYWGNTGLADVRWTFEQRHAARLKRARPGWGELSEAYQAFLEADRSAPRTLCNDDMLPLDVLEDNDRAVIIDWECAGILLYPCALVRFLAYSGETPEHVSDIRGGQRIRGTVLL